MSLKGYQEKFIQVIETELKRAIHTLDADRYKLLHTMMAYHMGWEGVDAGPRATGKRIRPIIVLLTTEAAGGQWESAVPAAVSLELIHNFSLLHDDIEDNSDLRRGRPTVWKNWGIPQALNTGDSMFSLAHLIMLRLEETTLPQITLKAIRILEETCLSLTKGQYLDISYQNRDDLTLEDYWPMVTGKTAALIAACTEIGALIAGADDDIRDHYRSFGLNLGLAFQALDDLLGIWGDSGKIGKSVASDLVEGKKSLPVLYGLEKQGEFSKRWKMGSITQYEVSELAKQLELEGAHTYTKNVADRLTTIALDELQRAKPLGEAGKTLTLLANQLLQREV